jgi:Carboxypeptidase regulatory-like domain
MIGLSVLLCAFPALAQSQQPARARASQYPPSAARKAATSAGEPDPQRTGSISGTVADQEGTALSGARVTLARDDGSPAQEAQSDDDGQFFFVNVASGPFQLAIAAEGFTTQTASGALHSGEAYKIPRIELAVARVMTQVRVTPSRGAEVQLKDEEKQRVLGVVPNFYVTYIPDAAPLNAKQKFELAWKSTIDPVTFLIVGASAGLQQAANQFSGYGQGAQGYGKRFGASYADVTINTFIGGAILPSLLKQDPRYFYKGSGSKRSRVLYALAASVICKGDNHRWQPNYSNILGSLAAGGLSNLYYPPQNRNDAALTFESTALSIGATAGANLLQEFVVPKFTSRKSSSLHPTQSSTQIPGTARTIFRTAGSPILAMSARMGLFR